MNERERRLVEAVRDFIDSSEVESLNYDVPEPAATDFRNATDDARQRLREALAAYDEEPHAE